MKMDSVAVGENLFPGREKYRWNKLFVLKFATLVIASADMAFRI
jgi:hypothetical protein